MSIIIEKHSGTIVSREARRRRVVLRIRGAFYGGEIRKSLIDFLHLQQRRRETKGRTTGSSEMARVRHSRTPAPPPDRGPQIYHRPGLYPAPDIISPPPIPCPVIRNPGAPTAHLFMSWHFSLLRSLLLLLFFPRSPTLLVPRLMPFRQEQLDFTFERQKMYAVRILSL